MGYQQRQYKYDTWTILIIGNILYFLRVCSGGAGDVLPINADLKWETKHLEKYFEKNNLEENFCSVVNDFGYSS